MTRPRSSALPAPPPGAPAVAPLAELPLTWCLSAVAKALGVSRRVLERERAAGRFPPPDLTIGRTPLWRVETIRRWVEGGGRP